MADTVVVHRVDIDTVVDINETIPEFNPYPRTYFEERLHNKKSLVIAAYISDHPVGYLVGYDRFNDGSFYCWMAGVNPAYRRKGVLKALMGYQEAWARAQGYNKIKIKTRNRLREMLVYLVTDGFSFVEVVQHPDIKDNRILLEKEL